MGLKLNNNKYSKLLFIIAKSDNEKIQDAFFDYQTEKKENDDRYYKYLDSILKEAETSNKAALNIGDVVVSELQAASDEGTPIIDEDGKKICNCIDPKQSRLDNTTEKWVCLNCWGEWYN